MKSCCSSVCWWASISLKHTALIFEIIWNIYEIYWKIYEIYWNIYGIYWIIGIYIIYEIYWKCGRGSFDFSRSSNIHRTAMHVMPDGTNWPQKREATSDSSISLKIIMMDNENCYA